jgi:hypothetical protein
MKSAYQIERTRFGWIVAHAVRGRVSVSYQTMEEAVDRLTTLQRKEQRMVRPCMCCRNPFESDGIHHRLCANCRSHGQDRQMAG